MHLRTVTYLVFLLPLLALQCRDGGPSGPPVVPEPEMPPITQSGKGTFACYLNGQVWHKGISHASYGFPEGSVSAKTEFEAMGFHGTIPDTGKYDIQRFDYPYWRFIRTDTTSVINRYQALPGSYFRVTKLDQVNNIFAGTFEFKAVGPDGDTVTATEGRFDIKYLY
jgi:hypothetical protein